MRKRIVIILALVAVAGAGVYAYRGVNRPGDPRILISGNIELTEVNIAFKTAGRLVERTVDEGDAVKKGQVIARLDRDQLVAQREREVAGLQSAESQLAQAQTSLEWERSTLAADIEQRTADVASSEARLAELKNGSRPQEKLDAQAAVDSAQSEVEHAKRDWDRAQVLHQNDDISTAQFDQFRNHWETANGDSELLQGTAGAGAGRSARGSHQCAAGATGTRPWRVKNGGGQFAGDEAARAGTGRPAARKSPVRTPISR